VNGRLTGRVRERRWETKDGQQSSWEYIVNMHPKPVTRSGFRLKSHARAALDDELEARRNGTWVEPSDQTLAQFLNYEWLPAVEADKRDITYDLYARMVRPHIVPHLGDLPLQSIRSKDVRDLSKTLKTKGSEGGHGPLGRSFIHNVHTTLHGALAFAVAEEKLRRNVADNTEPKRSDEDGGEVEFWTPGQVGASLDRVDLATSEHVETEERKRKGKSYTHQRKVAVDPMQRALLYTFVATGARRGEVCGLRWKDVDLVGGTVTVRKTRVMVNGAVKRSLPKTRRGRRILYVDPETVDALRAWQAAQAKEREAFAAQWQDEEDHVFTHVVRLSCPIRCGVPVRPDSVTRTFQKVAKQAGLPPLRLHGLRHSWATTGHLNGVGLRAIADQLGACRAIMPR
jgi:integrase